MFNSIVIVSIAIYTLLSINNSPGISNVVLIPLNAMYFHPSKSVISHLPLSQVCIAMASAWITMFATLLLAFVNGAKDVCAGFVINNLL